MPCRCNCVKAKRLASWVNPARAKRRSHRRCSVCKRPRVVTCVSLATRCCAFPETSAVPYARAC
eukprot:317-Eustigmatos_ZCMA.PRE.1